MLDLLFLSLISLATLFRDEITEPAMSTTTTATVVAVLDGDTIDVQLADGARERVRYIGIDTPEENSNGVPECFAQEATVANQQWVAGKTITLVSGNENRDQYSRLLRYVYVDGELVNELLVRDGFAVTLTIPPNTRLASTFQKHERDAQAQARGLWGACR